MNPTKQFVLKFVFVCIISYIYNIIIKYHFSVWLYRVMCVYVYLHIYHPMERIIGDSVLMNEVSDRRSQYFNLCTPSTGCSIGCSICCSSWWRHLRLTGSHLRQVVNVTMRERWKFGKVSEICHQILKQNMHHCADSSFEIMRISWQHTVLMLRKHKRMQLPWNDVFSLFLFCFNYKM